MRIISYSFVGGIAAIVDISFFTFFYQLLGLHLAICNILSFHLALFTNYFLGKVFVFPDRRKKRERKYFYGVYLVSATGMILNTLILYIMINQLDINSFASKIFAALPVFAWNYFLRLFQVYNR